MANVVNGVVQPELIKQQKAEQHDIFIWMKAEKLHNENDENIIRNLLKKQPESDDKISLVRKLKFYRNRDNG